MSIVDYLSDTLDEILLKTICQLVTRTNHRMKGGPVDWGRVGSDDSNAPSGWGGGGHELVVNIQDGG